MINQLPPRPTPGEALRAAAEAVDVVVQATADHTQWFDALATLHCVLAALPPEGRHPEELSPRDQAQIVAALENPPAPNAALKRAFGEGRPPAERLKDRSTPENAAYWDHVEQTAANVRANRPTWAEHQKPEERSIHEAMGLSGNLVVSPSGADGRAPTETREEQMQYESLKSPKFNDEWRVEAIDEGGGDCYVTLFCGPKAQARAEEYAAWKNGAAPTETPPPEVAEALRARKAGVWAVLVSRTTQEQRDRWGVSEDRPMYLNLSRTVDHLQEELAAAHSTPPETPARLREQEKW